VAYISRFDAQSSCPISHRAPRSTAAKPRIGRTEECGPLRRAFFGRTKRATAAGDRCAFFSWSNLSGRHEAKTCLSDFSAERWTVAMAHSSWP